MKSMANIFVFIAAFGSCGGEAFARGGSGGHGGSHAYVSSSRSSSGSSHSVSGYTKKNGTYVAPHQQTNPNKTKADNYSTKGNVNPYTGKAGTVDPTKQ